MNTLPRKNGNISLDKLWICFIRLPRSLYHDISISMNMNLWTNKGLDPVNTVTQCDFFPPILGNFTSLG